jgi:hypothetical protein
VTLRRIAMGDVREPIRILVTGGSVSAFVVPRRRSRAEGTYGEQLPRLLAQAGVQAGVEFEPRWFGLLTELRRDYERRVRNHMPDVLVLNYGMGECQPRIIPTWLARHLQSWDVGQAAFPRAYRRRLAPVAWRVLRRVQQVGSRWVGLHTWRVSPARFERELRRLIELVRVDVCPLVLFLDLDPPGPRITHWLPGIDRRREVHQEVLVRVVADYGPDVRLVRASDTVFEHGFDRVLPDGLHRTPFGHRLTAGLLADEILRWLDEPVDGA